MRKWVVSSLAIIASLLVIGFIISKEHHSNSEVSTINKIVDAPCAKFEMNGNSDNVVFVSSEIKTLTNVFATLDIVKTDNEVSSDWIYRITFNCDELSPAEEEIIVLIGPDVMLINGEKYGTPNNVPFESIVDLFASKYEYFSSSNNPN